MVSSLLAQRLMNHGLVGNDYLSPEEVVRHLLCLQAQDRTQHLRAIASRAHMSREDIEHAYNTGKIVRTWTQRGTIHVVSAEDALWMMQLCATKTLLGFSKRRAYLGISDDVCFRILDLIQAFLVSGAKTRAQITEYLQVQGVSIQSGRIYHMLCYAGTLGIIVQGPLVDGVQAFVLAEKWLPKKTNVTEEEMLRLLCFRYFASHGPATISDLQWWSGLSKTQIKRGIAACGRELEEVGDYYITSHAGRGLSVDISRVLFLAGFDERLLGYKDRTATLALEHHRGVDVSRNGIFKPTVMIDGKTVGVRSVKHKTKVAEVTIHPFTALSKEDVLLLQTSSDGYAQYLAKEVRVAIHN